MTATVTNTVTTSSESSKDCYKEKSSTPTQVSYGLHTYSSHLNWHLHHHPRPHPHSYYQTNSYKSWISSYKDQWRQHWQRFRGCQASLLHRRCKDTRTRVEFIKLNIEKDLNPSKKGSFAPMLTILGTQGEYMLLHIHAWGLSIFLRTASCGPK